MEQLAVERVRVAVVAQVQAQHAMTEREQLLAQREQVAGRGTAFPAMQQQHGRNRRRGGRRLECLQPRAFAAVDDMLAAGREQRRGPAQHAAPMQRETREHRLHVRIAQQSARQELLQERSRQRSSTRLLTEALAFHAPAVSVDDASG